jgi:hypothetical protein
VAPTLEDPGTCPFYSGSQGTCYEVYTGATSRKALSYITKQVASGSNQAQVLFYDSSVDGSFAKRCNEEYSGVSVDYPPYSQAGC